jgi:hypothetical protein
MPIEPASPRRAVGRPLAWFGMTATFHGLLPADAPEASARGADRPLGFASTIGRIAASLADRFLAPPGRGPAVAADHRRPAAG